MGNPKRNPSRLAVGWGSVNVINSSRQQIMENYKKRTKWLFNFLKGVLNALKINKKKMNWEHETNPKDSFVFLTKTDLFLSQSLILIPSSNRSHPSNAQSLIISQPLIPSTLTIRANNPWHLRDSNK